MYVHTELEPYLIFLNIFLTLCWSLSTWLTMQNKKLHSELIPQNQFLSKNGEGISCTKLSNRLNY